MTATLRFLIIDNDPSRYDEFTRALFASIEAECGEAAP